MTSYSKSPTSADATCCCAVKARMIVISFPQVQHNLLIHIHLSPKYEITYNIHHLTVDNILNESCRLWQRLPAVSKSMPEQS